MPGGAQFDDHPARLERQAGVRGERRQRAAQPFQRRAGVSGAAGMHGQGVPLVLDPGSLRGYGGLQHTRQVTPDGRHARRRGGRGHLAVLPAFPAVVAEHQDAGHVGQAAEPHGLLDRAPGDDGQRADRSGQPPQRGDGVRVGVRRTRFRHDRRQRAVEIGPDQRAGRRGQQRLQAGPPVRREGTRKLAHSGDRIRWRRERCRRSRFDQHRIEPQRLWPVDQLVEDLVVPCRRQFQHVVNGLLLRSRVPPGPGLEGQDPGVPLGSSAM